MDSLTGQANNKQFRIVKVGNNFVSKRVFKYQTSFGENSAGLEVHYPTWQDALKTEMKWLEKTSNNENVKS